MISSLRVVTRELFMQLLFPTFLIHLTRGLTVASIPLYILEVLDLSKFDVGVAVGAIGVGKILMDLPAGILLEKFGSRRLMILSASVLAFSSIFNFLVVVLSGSFRALVVGMFVYGAGQGAGVLSRVAMMSESIEGSSRGRVSALLGGSDRLGLAIGPLLAWGALWVGGMGAVFILQAGCAIASGFITKWSIAPLSVMSVSNNQNGHTFCTNQLNWKVLLNVSVYVLAIQLVREGRKLVIPMAGFEIGLSSERIAWLSTLSFGIDAALFLVSGSLMDSRGRIFSGTISLSLLVLSLLVIVPGMSSGTILLHAILSGIGNGLSAGIVPALGADFAPMENRSEFLGYFRLFADSGEFFGPFLVGIAAQFASISTTMNIVAAVGLVGSFWLTVFVPEPNAKTSTVSSPK